jgi:hypothetical protein
MARRHQTGGVRKRCHHPRRAWLTCVCPWQFHFRFKGRKHRYSLDAISEARTLDTPRSKEAALALADVIKSEIRNGTFVPPTPLASATPNPAAVTDARLVLDDVLTMYRDKFVDVPTRRPSAKQAMTWQLGVLARTELPAPRGMTVRLGDRIMAEITLADLEAIRDSRRVAQRALATRMANSGETGCNRLLARLRHVFTWALKRGIVTRTPFKDASGGAAIDFGDERKRRRRLVEDEEARLLTAAKPGSLLHALIVATLETGARLGELLALQWQAVRFRKLADGTDIAMPSASGKRASRRPGRRRLCGCRASSRRGQRPRRSVRRAGAFITQLGCTFMISGASSDRGCWSPGRACSKRAICWGTKT